jgi:Zn-dependent metalloprotease
MRLDSSVHYSTDYDNAFWNGMQMVYGDGDGTIFDRFTKCLDVIGHELTHGVTQYEAGLAYHDQPGALNESCSDIFGVLVKQWKLKQTADKADWLIGAGLLAKGVKGRLALMGARHGPDDPNRPGPHRLMKNYYKGSQTTAASHQFRIPNHAFYLWRCARRNAWEKAGKIWPTRSAIACVELKLQGRSECDPRPATVRLHQQSGAVSRPGSRCLAATRPLRMGTVPSLPLFRLSQPLTSLFR